MNAMNQRGNNEYRAVEECGATKGTRYLQLCVCVCVHLWQPVCGVPYFIQLLILHDQTRCAQLRCQTQNPIEQQMTKSDRIKPTQNK